MKHLLVILYLIFISVILIVQALKYMPFKTSVPETLEVHYAREYGLEPDRRDSIRTAIAKSCSLVTEQSRTLFGFTRLEVKPAWEVNAVAGSLCVVLPVRENPWSGALNKAFLVSNERLVE